MRYTNLETVMWRITKHPHLKNLSIEDVAEFAENLMKLMNVPASLITVVEEKNVQDFKVTIPSCAKDVLGVRYIDHDGRAFALIYSANPYHTSKLARDDKERGVKRRFDHVTPPNTKPRFEYSHSDTDYSPRDRRHDEYSYVLQGCNIITSFERGKVEVAYNKLPTDVNELPMIPDEESFVRALEYEIRMRYLEPQWEMGKITDKAFQRIQQERDWYVGQASTVMKTINYDQFDMMAKGVNRLLVNPRPRDTFWKRYGEQEKIHTHA